MENKLNHKHWPHVLYIDDEEGNLDAFKAAFRREYVIYTANSALEGLQLLSKHSDIQIIISDQRMPQITGVEFFQKILPIYPEKVRILLTGYSDIEVVIDAINKGEVFRFIDKPWDQDGVRMAVRSAKDLVDAREKAKKKHESLVKAYKDLDRFVYSISHDLRDPLMSIVGLIELAEHEVTEQTAIDYLKMIRTMTNKLDHFVNQIIDYYKMAQNSSSEAPVDFKSCLEDLLMEFKYHPDASNIRFETEVDDNIALHVRAVLMKSIMKNLVSNAIKYQKPDNPDKFVKIRVTKSSEHVTIQVEDNGIGVDSKQHDKIFEMFHRSTSSNNSGAGLGLYIVKEAVDILGGTIRLESEPGKGSVFTIKIPVRKMKS